MVVVLGSMAASHCGQTAQTAPDQSAAGTGTGGTGTGAGGSGGTSTSGGSGGTSVTAGAGPAGGGGGTAAFECTIIGGDFRDCVWQLRTKLDAARTCTLGAANQCRQTITDECGCAVAVNAVNSPEVACFFETLAQRDCAVCDRCVPVVGECRAEDAGVARCR
jgi:hypothetical protein